ncbi:MAG: crossover junction endodeoxyribonuclease RuvC [Thermoanaerobaculales bacterium]|jgi:crossover junction endodeoxyribonuclease RuvC|nr:crossover junction endodeoxyribonuclease RuvC [Thermoanaerobaculales bacterium]
MRVLGVDPGSRVTGWALVVNRGNRSQLERLGVVRPRGADHPLRLADLDRHFTALVAELAPDCAAVESGFTGRNPRSGLILAESRGVLLAALGRAGVPVHAYTPAQVKSAMVGHGTAEKQQVAFMVVRLLGLAAPPSSDAADAVGVALTHLHSTRLTGSRGCRP